MMKRPEHSMKAIFQLSTLKIPHIDSLSFMNFNFLLFGAICLNDGTTQECLAVVGDNIRHCNISGTSVAFLYVIPTKVYYIN